MKFFPMIILYLVINNPISGIQIGVIHNASLMVMASSNKTINGITCDECVCAMLNNSANSSIVSFNCYIESITNVSCQLFTMTDYQNSFYPMRINFQSTFYFLQLPLNIEVQMTTSRSKTLYFSIIFINFPL